MSPKEVSHRQAHPHMDSVSSPLGSAVFLTICREKPHPTTDPESPHWRSIRFPTSSIKEKASQPWLPTSKFGWYKLYWDGGIPASDSTPPLVKSVSDSNPNYWRKSHPSMVGIPASHCYRGVNSHEQAQLMSVKPTGRWFQLYRVVGCLSDSEGPFASVKSHYPWNGWMDPLRIQALSRNDGIIALRSRTFRRQEAHESGTLQAEIRCPYRGACQGIIPFAPMWGQCFKRGCRSLIKQPTPWL